MISRGRINLFYSRDETMNFFCLANAALHENLFVSEQFSVVFPSPPIPQPHLCISAWDKGL